MFVDVDPTAQIGSHHPTAIQNYDEVNRDGLCVLPMIAWGFSTSPLLSRAYPCL